MVYHCDCGVVAAAVVAAIADKQGKGGRHDGGWEYTTCVYIQVW